jgi:hypothetical protein
MVIFKTCNRPILCGVFKPEASTGGQCPHTDKREGVYHPAKLCRVSGLVGSFPLDLVFECRQRPIFGAQREGLCPGHGHSRHDWPQTR